MSEDKKQERKVEPLGPHGIHTAEHRRVVYFAIAAKGVEPGDLLSPAYWAHVAASLKPRDRVEVNAEDGAWYCEVMVLDVSRAYARVVPVVGPIHLTTADVAQTQDSLYDVSLRGPKKWSIVRKSDRQVMHEGEETRDGAVKWLKDNAAKLAA